jgi:hypothetical protein
VKQLFGTFMSLLIQRNQKSFNQFNQTMKNQTLRFLTRIIGSVLFSMALSFTATAYPSGSPAGYTGSPGDGSNCISCHGGSVATVNGWITSNIPATGYVAGTVYNITATVSGTGKKGFEVSPQNAAGAQLGVLTAGTNNHLTGGTKYVTQNSSGSTSSTVIYNFTWTAPAAGTGDVTFYGAFTVGKTNTKLSTLLVSENAAIPLSAEAFSIPGVICAGQTSQLNVVPAGGSGTYTYSWTSVPAGFTSSLQNPVVTPGTATQYTAHVTDGALSVDASTSVAVNQPATAAAGDDTTCAFITTQVPLNGIATNYSAVQWTTSGTGNFSAASAISGNYLPSAADKTGGDVTLTLTATPVSPCETAIADARIIHFDGPTGIMDADNALIGMTISPNPSTGLFKLMVTGLDHQNAMVTISDITGKMLVQRGLFTSDNQQEQFDLSGSPKGIYFVKIQTSKKVTVRKLVIE